MFHAGHIGDCCMHEVPFSVRSAVSYYVVSLVFYQYYLSVGVNPTVDLYAHMFGMNEWLLCDCSLLDPSGLFLYYLVS